MPNCSPSPTSSSAAATKIRSPAGSKPSRASDAIATALAATWPFMSSAPRPHTWPSLISPDQGSTDHSAGSASTVSVWDMSKRRGPPPRPGMRATRFARSGTFAYSSQRDAVVLEVLAEELGRPRLVARRVDRVDLDEPLEEVDDLAHRFRPEDEEVAAREADPVTLTEPLAELDVGLAKRVAPVSRSSPAIIARNGGAERRPETPRAPRRPSLRGPTRPRSNARSNQVPSSSSTWSRPPPQEGMPSLRRSSSNES